MTDSLVRMVQKWVTSYGYIYEWEWRSAQDQLTYHTHTVSDSAMHRHFRYVPSTCFLIVWNNNNKKREQLVSILDAFSWFLKGSVGSDLLYAVIRVWEHSDEQLADVASAIRKKNTFSVTLCHYRPCVWNPRHWRREDQEVQDFFFGRWSKRLRNVAQRNSVKFVMSLV